MQTLRLPTLTIMGLITLAVSNQLIAEPPAVPEDWKIELLAEAPDILFPTAMAVAADGTIYIGQDPMDMGGPVNKPIDRVVALRREGEKWRPKLFAKDLYAVMGLEVVEDTVFVVHAPFLSALRDTNGDGVADSRVDLVTGLGPADPSFSGLNDHVASGMRLGMDGFLYISVGDKGMPKATGSDGRSVTLFGGGVIRVRPDGSDLEIVATGLRNPLSVALTTNDDVFTYGNDDDSKQWPNAIIHGIDGGHYGYPYQFIDHPERCLPWVDGVMGGSGAQGISYNEDGLAPSVAGSLLFADWGQRKVFQNQLEPNGATFKLSKRTELLSPGKLDDFRPFSIHASADGASLYVVDWAFNGWLRDDVESGRLFRLTYEGDDARIPAPRRTGDTVAGALKALGHPSHAERLRAQDDLAQRGTEVVGPLMKLLASKAPPVTRRHALWTLDQIGGPAARSAVRAAMVDAEPTLRRHAARSAGIRRERAAVNSTLPLLSDADPIVRREAAIALGRIGDRKAIVPILKALAESDPIVAWSLRTALRRIGHWDADQIVARYESIPKGRRNLLLAMDEVWDPEVVDALAQIAQRAEDPADRAQATHQLAGLYRKYPPWNGFWFGTNPMIGDFPKKTLAWDAGAMAVIVHGLAAALRDTDPSVRHAAIQGLDQIGAPGVDAMTEQYETEKDLDNRLAIVGALGHHAGPPALRVLKGSLQDANQPITLRRAVVRAVGEIGGQAATGILKQQLSRAMADAGAPSVTANLLRSLARDPSVDASRIAWALGSKSHELRRAGLDVIRLRGKANGEMRKRVLEAIGDENVDVRRTAIRLAGTLKIADAAKRLLSLVGDPKLSADVRFALTAVPDADAVNVYIDGLSHSDPEHRIDCQRALLTLRGKVTESLRTRAKVGDLPRVSLLAIDRVLATLRPATSWRTLGPLPRTSPDLFPDKQTVAFEKQASGADGSSISWQPAAKVDPVTGQVNLEAYKKGNSSGGFGYDVTGSPDVNAYAFAEIQSPQEREALMVVGSSGPIWIYLNGKEVYSYNVDPGRGYEPDTDMVRVLLQNGPNRILVFSYQGIGVWSFSVQVSAPQQDFFSSRSGKPDPEAFRQYAMTHTGNIASGRETFFATNGVGCVTCHRIDGVGAKDTIGPDLAGLASKYDRAEIITSVLEPSKRLATGYQPIVVSTDDGRVVSGLLRSETSEQLVLVDNQGTLKTIDKETIEVRRRGTQSPMPGNLIDTVTTEQFANLIEYLSNLKTPERKETQP